MKDFKETRDLRPRKSLGQHFLGSDRVLNKIVAASNLGEKDTVLEVGPGLGYLTEKLLEKVSKVIAVEKDSRLIPFLGQKFSSEISSDKLQLIQADILSLDLSAYFKSKSYKIVANLPYYITGKFLRKYLSEGKNENSKPQSLTLLLQKEVAQRIVARDGKESLLSISVKLYGKPHYVATVKKELFKPRPKVDSAILHIDEMPRQEVLNEVAFFKIAKNGFSKKRKKLIGNLKTLVNNGFWEEAFKDCHINQNARAEELSTKSWFCLVDKYSKTLRNDK